MSTHATFVQRMRSLLRDNASERYVSRKRVGKLDTRRVSRISYSSRLFKRKEERLGKDYHVSLLVDASGSMQGEKDRQAIKAVRKLADALGRVGVNFEVTAFNTCDYVLRPFSRKVPTREELARLEFDYLCITGGGARTKTTTDGTRFNPEEFALPLEVYEIENGTRLVVTRDAKEAVKLNGGDRTVGYRYTTCGWNADGKSVAEATARLLEQKGGKHILIVLSDGQPEISGISSLTCGDRTDGKTYGDFELKKEVQRAIKKGVAVCSVGVCTRSVEEYYPANNVRVVYDVERELYPAIVSLINHNVRRGE